MTADLDEGALTEARADLAAAFRWTARLNMHEGVANHYSLAVSGDGRRFLMNPDSRHFSRIRASELLLLDADDPQTMNAQDAPDPTAWTLHGRMHASLPQARCVLHAHPKYTTVLASLADSTIYPIDQTTARFYGQIALDDGFGGMALGDEEGDRLAAKLGNKSVLMMGNHGIMVIGETVGSAFDALYYVERAARTLVTAYMTGKPLRLLSDEVARRTADQWATYPGLAEKHFAELKRLLDEDEPDYRT
ncbi:MAG: class II aldolase and adducin N-terminal domain-containing protein [Alphaproteobacteria bacterium]